MRSRFALLWATVLLVTIGCGGSEQPTAQPVNATRVDPGDGAQLLLPRSFDVELLAGGLNGPTALARGPDNALYIAQLGGGENAGEGQIIVLDAAGQGRMVLDNLLKPTGLAWGGDELWIAAGRDVLRSRFGADGTFAAPETIVRDLPFNGRSEGHITALNDGRMLYIASGAIGNDGSGKLWTIAGDQPPQELARGLKNAYAHTVDRQGRLWATEIGDDTMDGVAPPEEINLITPGSDGGWPRCYADRIPANNRGGTATFCDQTEPPVVTFPPHSTPTGLAVWDHPALPVAYRDALFVALWNGAPPQIAVVAIEENGDRITGQAEPFITGLLRPIDVLADQRGGLLVLDHQRGSLYRVSHKP
jgi:glucose/arabinose dehydrogenase